jgi:hypothetical protein
VRSSQLPVGFLLRLGLGLLLLLLGRLIRRLLLLLLRLLRGCLQRQLPPRQQQGCQVLVGGDQAPQAERGELRQPACMGVVQG